MKPVQPIRLLIADDSATSRAALRKIVGADSSFLIVGEAQSGEEALRLTAELRPSLVLMDVFMPGMGGIAATRRLMHEMPTPIVIVSDLAGAQGDLHFQALDAGALDIVRKPSLDDLLNPHFCTRFCKMIRALSSVPLVTRTAACEGRAGHFIREAPISIRSRAARHKASPNGHSKAYTASPGGSSEVHNKIVNKTQWIAIGASTGGPPAIRTLLSSFAPAPPWPVLIVQHITAGFEDSMAGWLAAECGIQVVLAESGMVPAAGTVYLSPVGRHLVFKHGQLKLEYNHPYRIHCPSINVFFESLAASGTAHHGIAVLLTGMGSDGASGLLAIRRAGGKTIVQDEDSCAVFGMPKAAADAGAADEILPLDAIGPRLLALTASSNRKPIQ